MTPEDDPTRDPTRDPMRDPVRDPRQLPEASADTDADAPTDPAGAEHLGDALAHLSTAVEENSIAVGAAKGLVYSIIETLGTLVGDPDLPEHARSGYEGLLETAREIRARIEGERS
ncbi:Major surface protein 3 [Cupriavidus sp. H18C1]